MGTCLSNFVCPRSMGCLQRQSHRQIVWLAPSTQALALGSPWSPSQAERGIYCRVLGIKGLKDLSRRQSKSLLSLQFYLKQAPGDRWST